MSLENIDAGGYKNEASKLNKSFAVEKTGNYGSPLKGKAKEREFLRKRRRQNVNQSMQLSPNRDELKQIR